MHTPSTDRAARGEARRNMTAADRWGSLAAGAGLALFGLGRRRGAGLLLAGLGALLIRRGYTGHCDTYQAAGLDFRHRHRRRSGDTRRALGGRAGIKVHEAITVNRTPAELYQFWRQLENLPRFMSHVKSVSRDSDTRSHWRVAGPGGRTVEWHAEIINEVPDQLIAWKSIGQPSVVSAGSVHFDAAGDGRGTRVRVNLQYSPPGGKAVAAVASLFGRDAASEIREDLRRFKQLLETGEVATTTGQPRGGR